MGGTHSQSGHGGGGGKCPHLLRGQNNGNLALIFVFSHKFSWAFGSIKRNSLKYS
jgi:hypothetical protein